MAAATAEVAVNEPVTTKAGIAYPGDAYLEKPLVYYNPEAPNIRFVVYQDPEGKLRYQPEQFAHGRYVAETVVQNNAVRRVLRHMADEWQGEDARRDLKCDNPACDFRTRNSAAFEAHQRLEKLRHDVRPDIPGVTR